MPTLRIHLFGAVRIAWDETGEAVRPTRNLQGLLAYLVLHRHRLHSRQGLAGVFWGEVPEDKARNCLSTSLWRLRRLLAGGGGTGREYLVSGPLGEVGFNRESDHWLDVEVFEQAARRAGARPFHSLEPADADRLHEALGLYTADALEGFYEDWALRDRERLRALHLEGLGTLMRFYGYHGRYEDAVAVGQRLLECDPLREGVHREMMRLYLESGQRPLAVQQFRACQESLRTHLGLQPMAETQALYRSALDATVPETAPPTPPNLQDALRELGGAVRAYEDARTRLDQALQAVTRLTGTG